MAVKKVPFVLSLVFLLLFSGINVTSYPIEEESGPSGGPAVPSINAFLLVDGENGNVCLSRYRAYSFNTTINDTDGTDDIKYVNITIEPYDENITLCWSRDATPHFSKLNDSDPNDHINLSSNDTHWGDIDTNTTFVNFQLNFNWTYPDEDLSNITLNVTDGNNNSNATTYENLFKVENDLGFNGLLSVTGEYQGSLVTGDWVRTSENMTFSGLKVTYEGFASDYPSNDYFNVSVTNGTGTSWYNNSSEGQPFSISVASSSVSEDSNDHNVSINKLPVGREGNVSANQTFNIKVDGEVPSAPDNITIHADTFLDNRTYADNDTTFFVTWNISVDSGSGTKRYYYSFENNEGNVDTNSTVINKSIIADPTLIEGTVTFYLWCEDNVGNIGSSATDTIIFDSTAPTYWGLPDNVMIDDGIAATNDSHLTFEWDNFTDPGATPSGLDYYYYSFNNNGGSTNGILDYESPGELFGASDGTVHVYVWVVDKAGNIGLSDSDSIIVDTEEVYFENPSPSTSAWVNTSLVTCEIDIRDNTTGVLPNTIDYRYYNGSTSNWISAGYSGGAQQLFTPSAALEFAPGSNNYVQWRAGDDVTNGPTASLQYTVQVDLIEPDNSNASVVIEGGAANVDSNVIFFEWGNFTDSGGAGIKGYYYNFTNGSGTTKGIYTANTNVTATSPTNGTVSIYVWAVDDAGNIGNATEDDIYIDHFAPNITNAWISINTGDVWSNSRTLHLTWGGFTDPTLTGYYYSFTDGGGTTNGIYTTGNSADINNAPVQRNAVVYVWAKDAYNHYSAAVTDNIHVDTQRPYFTGGQQLRIENGSKFTNDVFVHYNFTGITDAGVDQSGISGYYYAYTNNSGTTNGDLITTTIGVIKVPSDGSKNIWIWGADVAGNIQNRALRATILLDTVAPAAGSITLQNGLTYWNSSSAQVRWSGFSDENDPISRGIAGYYFSETNSEGTTTGYFSNGGLRAHYYNGNNFNTYVWSNYVGSINRNFQGGGPGGGVNVNQFSIIYNGSIFCPYSETYTFKCGSDDGFRLYIDDIYRMGYWGTRGYAQNSASVYLERGFHRFKMHYYEGGGPGQVTAKWSSAHINEAIISSYYFWAGQTSDTIPIVGEGNKRVYTWAQDYSFNIGDAIYDDIFVDLTPPSPSSALISVENDARYCSDTTLEVNWSDFADPAPASNIRGYYISYSNGSGTNTGIFTNYTNYTLHAPEGNLTVFVWAEDMAGNRGNAVTDTIEVIYPKLSEKINCKASAFRGKTNIITMNLTDVVFGEGGLNLTLEIWEGSGPGVWEELPVRYYDDGELAYWHSSYTPPLSMPINTILDLRLRYTNPGGYISRWETQAFKAVNNVPQINSTPGFTAPEDNDIVIDFNRYGWDVEDGNDPELAKWFVLTYKKYMIKEILESETSNRFIFKPIENYYGNTSVFMKFTDKDGDYVEKYFNLSWANVNDPPMVFEDTQKAVYIEEDNDTVFQLDMEKIFYDVDGDELNIGIDNATNVNLTIGPMGIVNITTKRDWFGTENITFTASDGIDHANLTISFIVGPINDPPIVANPFSTFNMDEDTVSDTLDLNDVFSDADDLVLLYLAMTESKEIKLSILEGNILTIMLSPDWYGEADITVSAVDPKGEMAKFTFTLNVTEVNDIPIAYILTEVNGTLVPTINPRLREMERNSADMILSGEGTDKEGAIVDYRWFSSVDGYLDLGNKPEIDLRGRSNLTLGRHVIDLTVKDQDGAWSSPVSIEIFVTAPSLSIEFKFDDRSIREGDSIKVVVRVTNNGTAAAREVNVTLRVDGTRVDWKMWYYIDPGETKTIDLTWVASGGEHNITIDTTASNHPSILMDVTGDESLDVKADASFWAFIVSLVLAFVILVGFFAFSVFSKKRRRKKVLRELLGKIQEANKTGVGTLEVKNMLEDVENEYGIKLK